MGYLIPPRKRPTTDEEYFEILSKAVFLAGFNWKVVEQKWPGFVQVFNGFRFTEIALWDEQTIVAAASNTTIIRNIRKVRAVVSNAQEFLSVVKEYGSFREYIEKNREKPYPERSKILTRRFKWLGRTGVFFFLFSVNEEVPDWTER
ncbi:MAG TPA: DNA-3-methyladenine glycosylase I [Candidatus Hodarchaeales archaeon]|nr:DNA-3-methyladenine glycosylase I [Candidatus Hodarchaeales archaeon]